MGNSKDLNFTSVIQPTLQQNSNLKTFFWILNHPNQSKYQKQKYLSNPHRIIRETKPTEIPTSSKTSMQV